MTATVLFTDGAAIKIEAKVEHFSEDTGDEIYVLAYYTLDFKGDWFA